LQAAQSKKGKAAEKSPQEESAPSVVGGDAASVNELIIAQGNTVRDLKAAKAGKAEVTAAVNTLLALKADYKQLTGQDWKPGEERERKENKKDNDSRADLA
jgi:bifunctional glutamyl/prolyl-tRNA synthetase